MAQKGSAAPTPTGVRWHGRNYREGPLETDVTLKLGSIPKSTAEDVKRWIESFGASEVNKRVRGGKLVVTGRVAAERLLMMVQRKSPIETGGADIYNLNRGYGEFLDCEAFGAIKPNVTGTGVPLRLQGIKAKVTGTGYRCRR